MASVRVCACGFCKPMAPACLCVVLMVHAILPCMSMAESELWRAYHVPNTSCIMHMCPDHALNHSRHTRNE